jgi:hypothetical protein
VDFGFRVAAILRFQTSEFFAELDFPLQHTFAGGYYFIADQSSRN